MAPRKIKLLDENTTKSSPPTDTDVKYMDREIQDQPIDFSKKTKWSDSQDISSPLLHLQLPHTPLNYNFPNNRERPLMLKTPLIPTPINDPSTSQSCIPHSSVPLNNLVRGESLKNGNKSSTSRRKEMLKRWKNKPSPVEEVFKNRSPAKPFTAYNGELNDTIRRLERQSTVGEISKPTLSSKSQVLFENKRKFSNTDFPQVESEEMLREHRHIGLFCSGPFPEPINHQIYMSAPMVNSSSGSNTLRNGSSNTHNYHISSRHTQRRYSDEDFLPGPINHQILMSAPVANSSSRSKTLRKGSSNAHNYHISSYTQSRCSDEALSLFPIYRESIFLPGPESSNSLEEAPGIPVHSSDSSSSSSCLPPPFNEDSQNYPGSHLTTPITLDGPGTFRSGYWVNVIPQPTYTQNLPSAHEEEPDGNSNAKGRAKGRNGQNQSNGHYEEPVGISNAKGRAKGRNGQNQTNGHYVEPVGISNAKGRAKGCDGQNLSNVSDAEHVGNSNAKGRAKGRDGQNQSNVPDAEPVGNSNAKGRAKGSDDQNQSNVPDVEPVGNSNAKGRTKGCDGQNQSNVSDAEPVGNSNAKGRAKCCDGQNQSNVPDAEPVGISNAKGRAKGCDGQNQPNGHDEEPEGISNAESKAKRRKGQPVPEEEKDEKCLKRREKNRKASYRARKKRLEREQQAQNELIRTRKENEVLKLDCQEMEYKLNMVENLICNPCFFKLR